MTASIREWESDPLFSAAEVVQDSADRMESLFRMLLHEQALVQEDPVDPKLNCSIDYHRRDLATALGTTRWQLEDFERAVNIAAASDWSRTREDAISRHRQFIRAIQEHISQVDKSLKDPSAGGADKNAQWVNLNQQDRDGLAAFLSGGSSIDHRILHESENGSIMRRFLDSTAASVFEDNTDEIIELKSEEELEDSKVNGVLQVDHSIDFGKENKLRKVGSSYSTRLGMEASVPIEDEVGGRGAWDIGECDSNAKSIFAKNKCRGLSWMDNLGFLRRFWGLHGSKLTRSFTKRRKDGEARIDFDQRPSSSYLDIPQADQCQHAWMRLTSGYRSCRGLYANVFTKTMNSSKGRLQRLQYFIQHNRSSMLLISAIIIIVITIGILAFRGA